ncbi:MAG: DNA-directed RNA polymerase subunit beta' [Chloroflexi bacterium]|nr:DNA-directed RNA polymerase subunit beta' [Chloroflexota bacterium]
MLEVNNFNAIRISLASPEKIKEWSHGEVTKPETINYRTLKPERDGLFCERIFGPQKDWECYCGKYKRVRYKGTICDKCGVEVTRSRVRRERMGHIELASPVSHIWYVKGTPSRLGLLLDISPRNLERVLYFATYIVTEVNEEERQLQVERVQADAEKRVNDIVEKTQARINDLQSGLREEIAEIQASDKESRTELDANLKAAKKEAGSQMRAIERQLKKQLGQALAEDIYLPGSNTVVASAGEVASDDTIARLKQIAEEHLSDVQEAIRRQSQHSQDIAGATRDQRSYVAIQESEQIQARANREVEEVRRHVEERIDQLEKIALHELITEQTYREISELFPGVFHAGMGAEAILDIVGKLDLDSLASELRHEFQSVGGQRRKKAAKRLRVVEAFRKSENHPAWMMFTALPVIPPDLRPMVQLDGGRFATSDLNDLYRRVINRNNRLKRLLELGAPEIIIRNEKRMLQESVDALIDNGRRGRVVSGSGKHRLKSLSDMLKGKQGRFRQNLLGKRVDYSGRSVIVVGPELKLHQCGLPKKMALELFKPFVMRRLVSQGLAHNIKSAKRIVERVRPEVWDVLEEVIKDYLVLLNRAPSLHRLSIQAFEAVLIEGSAIHLHPLVCSAFNADFDGDQMAVHVPLSSAAQREARERMLSVYNMLSPANGDPIVSPSQDIVLGCYYMTVRRPGTDGEGKAFSSRDEAILAYNSGVINLQAPIFVRMPRPDGKNELLDTTAGRLIFNEVVARYNDRLPVEEQIAYRNQAMEKGALRALMGECHRKLGAIWSAEIADAFKRLGFRFATKSGMSVAVADIEMPANKAQMLEKSDAEVEQIERAHRRGLITEQERYETVIRIWNETTDALTNELEKVMDPYGLISTLANSGATKARFKQIRQLAAMRGLIADPSGRIIDLPIRSNFREGLTVLEYFVSTHGGRKGLADTALRTADAGYLTRRLVDVAQDVIVLSNDCGATSGIWLSWPQNKDVADTMASRVIGRFAGQPITHPLTGEIILDANEEITEEVMHVVTAAVEEWLAPRRDELAKSGKSIDEQERLLAEERANYQINVRSPLLCEMDYGVCQLCYGRSLHNNKIVDMGEAVGIIAAQSIGEPGTQLTLRTFHTGGVASSEDITQGLPRVEELFEARVPKGQAILAEIDGVVEIIREEEGGKKIRLTHSEVYDDDYPLPRNHELLVAEGDMVAEGDPLFRSPLKGHEDDVTLARVSGRVIVESKKKLVIRAEEQEQREHLLPHNAQFEVTEGEHVNAGQPLTRGAQNPQEILHILGREAVQRYLVDEVQRVYRSQGVNVNDKHIEVIVRQMLRKVRVDMPGDTELLPGEMVERFVLTEVNARAIAAGGEAAMATPVLLGITKASLSTDSFLSAASFQETTRVLTEAAINGQVDRLRGLKENVIIGKLIPAGSGARFGLQPDFDMVAQGENIDTYLSATDSLSAYEGENAPGLGAGLEIAEGFTEATPAYPLELDGDGNGFASMPGFAPLPYGTESSAELTAALLEPEADLEADEDVAEAAEDDAEQREVASLGEPEASPMDFLNEHGTTFDPDEGTGLEEA